MLADLATIQQKVGRSQVLPHCHHPLGVSFKLCFLCLLLAWAMLQLHLHLVVDPVLWAWLSCLSSALAGDLLTCLACVIWVLWDMPLVGKLFPLPACHPQPLAQCPLKNSPALVLPSAQLRFHIYTAAVSGAGLVRACLGVCACHCSSLNSPACSLRACLDTSSTMVALCNVALTSLPSVSKSCVRIIFYIKHCPIFANTILVLMTPEKVPEMYTFWLQLN